MAKKSFDQLQPDARKLAKALKQAFEQSIRQGAAMTETHYKSSWRKQGYADKSDKWQPRKSKDKRDKGRAILVGPGTGHLRNSIKAKPNITQRTIIISADKPYAQIHNEGGTISATQNVKSHKRRTNNGSTTVKAHARNVNTKIPQRQFMPIKGDRGVGKALEDKIYQNTVTILDKVITPIVA